MPDRMSDMIECQSICQIECQKECQNTCQKVCQNRCQIESQIECQSICQKERQIECQNKYAIIYIYISRWYVRNCFRVGITRRKESITWLWWQFSHYFYIKPIKSHDFLRTQFWPPNFSLQAPKSTANGASGLPGVGKVDFRLCRLLVVK